MKDKQISLEIIGASRGYLSLVKCANIEKYNYIFSFDNDRVKSIVKYKKYIEEVYQKVQDIYYNYDGVFGRWLFENGFYSHLSSQNFEKMIFKMGKGYLGCKLDSLRKMEKIIEVYEKEQDELRKLV